MNPAQLILLVIKKTLADFGFDQKKTEDFLVQFTKNFEEAKARTKLIVTDEE